MRILMVCLGNICRSPLAEGIMKTKVAQAGLNWSIDSAGTGHWHAGELPDRRSIAIARQNGIDITDQRARQFKPEDLERFDLILAMDTRNHADILHHARTEAQREKVRLILDYSHPGTARSVPDPYYDDNGFQHVFELLHEACEQVLLQHQ
jgi:protein-tyrosine phosphatase